MKVIWLAWPIVMLVLGLSSCESYVGRGAAYGAGTGAIIGGLAGNSDRDVVRGAAIGAGVGALVGAIVQEHERERFYREGPRGGYPYGERTRSRGIVRSPYYPYNLIDVRGIPPGALVIDPSTNRPFIRP
jgi:hypothetical protein